MNSADKTVVLYATTSDQWENEARREPFDSNGAFVPIPDNYFEDILRLRSTRVSMYLHPDVELEGRTWRSIRFPATFGALEGRFRIVSTKEKGGKAIVIAETLYTDMVTVDETHKFELRKYEGEWRVYGRAQRTSGFRTYIKLPV
jgi:hypothetical protein